MTSKKSIKNLFVERKEQCRMRDKELFTKKGLDGIGGALVGVVSVVIMSGVLVLYIMGLRELQQKTYASAQTNSLAKLLSKVIQIEPSTAQTDSPNKLLRQAVSQTFFPRTWILSFQWDEENLAWRLFLESGNQQESAKHLRSPGTKYDYVINGIDLKDKTWPFSETITRYGKTLSKNVRFITMSYEGVEIIEGSTSVKIIVVVLSK